MQLFGTAGIRGPVPDRVSPDLALAVGQAVGRDAETVVLGRDGRETGAALADAVAAGLQSVGTDVRRLGVVPTPTVADASRGRRGVAITASHNPPADNGIKLFVDGREYEREAERRIEARIEDGVDAASWDDWGESRSVSVLEAYRERVVDYAEGHGAAPTDLTVAVDCGTGTAGLATPQVLTDLGATVRAVNANVDGHFPARASKPTPESLEDFSAFVASGEADLGVAHDGDADRIVVLAADGSVVHEDTVLAILAEHYVAASEAADPVVVTTPNASARIDDRVDAAGGRVERVGLGALHEGVIAAEADGDAGTAVVFAAEPWKHVHPAFGDWIDGVVSAALLVRLVAETGLHERRAAITERPYRKRSVSCPDDRKADAMAELATALPEAFPDATVDTEYGIRLDVTDGWTLVRPSGTEPYLRIYAEHEDVETLVDEVEAIVERAIAG